jgi:hypothetical protein
MAQYHPLPTRQYCQQHSHPSFSWGQDLPPHPEPSIVSTTPTQPISQRPLQQLAQPSSRVLTCMTDITARNNHRLLLTVREFALLRRFTGSLRFEASMSDEIVRYSRNRPLETTWLFFEVKRKFETYKNLNGKPALSLAVTSLKSTTVLGVIRSDKAWTWRCLDVSAKEKRCQLLGKSTHCVRCLVSVRRFHVFDKNNLLDLRGRFASLHCCCCGVEYSQVLDKLKARSWQTWMGYYNSSSYCSLSPKSTSIFSWVCEWPHCGRQSGSWTQSWQMTAFWCKRVQEWTLIWAIPSSTERRIVKWRLEDMFNIQTDMQMHTCGMCSHRGKKNLRFAYGNPSDRRNEGFISCHEGAFRCKHVVMAFLCRGDMFSTGLYAIQGTSWHRDACIDFTLDSLWVLTP